MSATTVQQIIASVQATGHTLSLGPGNTLLLDGAPQPPGHGRYLVWQHAEAIAAHLAATQPPATPATPAAVLDALAAKATRERDGHAALTVSPRPGPTPGSGPAPTREQQAAIEAFGTGESLVLEAGAGAGKTSTLRMLACSAPRRSMVYLAYNKAIAGDARRSFPPNVACSTAHGLAMRAVGRPLAHRLRSTRMPARETARVLGINEPVKIDERMLAPQQLARLTMSTVERFCRSAHEQIEWWHVTAPTGIDTQAQRRALAAAIVPYARRAWADLTRPDGRLRFSHDHYLKLWQLSGPRLGVDVVMLDEAQDANPCVASVVDRQHDAQRVLVGDSCQAINGWNGAIDAMAKFTGRRLRLSQSFRFGPVIAAEANKWLALLDSDMRLTGFDQIHSRLAALGAPRAILTRTNAGAIGALLTAATTGQSAALVGGGREIRSLAEAAIELREGRGTGHAELLAFRTWGEVQEYAEQDESGSDLRVFVRLIDEHTPEGVLRIVDRLVEEKRADVIVSTAHKAKGREWPSVRIADDFRAPKPDNDGIALPAPGELMLAYVAVTRAREVLDRDGLAWVDHYLTASAMGGDPR